MDPQKLDYCVKVNDVEGARRLVRLGTPVDGLVDRRSPLMRATMGNRLAMVDALLDMGASVDFTNEEGWTALHHAAMHGVVQVVDVLLDAGADLEAKSNSGRTPLAMACRKKKLVTVQKLLERGADASTRDNAGWTLLFHAARAGSLEVVKWLVEELNADPRLEVGDRPAAELANTHGHEEIAKYLCDAVNSFPNPSSGEGCGGATGQRVRHTSHMVQPGPEVYNTTTDPPGIVLLLNYKTFLDKNLQTRHGAEYDVVNIVSVFEQMGYEVEVHEDLTWEDTIWTVQEFSTSERLRKVGCAIVVVSSHNGREISSFATFDDKDVSVKYIHECFIKNQSWEVRQMAKIFFFQFCRGDICPIRQTDNANHAPMNIISFFSTSDGFVAFRDPKKGSIFLSILCEVLAERAYKDNLDDLFREIQVRYKREGVGTTPEKQDLGFMKKFYFNPRVRK